MKTLVFTFDDGIHTHHSLVRPLFKKHGLTGTFFIPGHRTMWLKPPQNCPENEGKDLRERALSWREVRELNVDGFEIGNHTWQHIDFGYGGYSKKARTDQIERLESHFEMLKIPPSTTFCYPGYSCSPPAAKFLTGYGFKFARAGYVGGPSKGPLVENRPENRRKVRYYRPGQTDPMYVPSTGILNDWYTLDNFKEDLEGTPEGCVAVFTAHGFARKSRWKTFKQIIKYVTKKKYHVIKFRDMPL